MNSDKMMRLAHEAGMVEWFNSDKTDWMSYRNAFSRFAVLVENHVRASNMTPGRVDADAKSGHEWVGIDEEEIDALWQRFDVAKGWSPSVFALAVAHKLKEQNT